MTHDPSPYRPSDIRTAAHREVALVRRAGALLGLVAFVLAAVVCVLGVNLADARAQTETARGTVATLGERVDAASADAARKDSEVDALTQRLAEVTAERDQAREALQNVTVERDDALVQRDDLVVDLNATTDTLEDVAAERDSMAESLAAQTEYAAAHHDIACK